MASTRDDRAQDTAAVPYVLEPEEGEAIRWFGRALTVKASGPSFDVALTTERAGTEPPLHVHAEEDEALFVLEGAVTVVAGEEVMAAGAGSFVFLPRGVPHTFAVRSAGARLLVVLGPSGSLAEHGFSLERPRRAAR